MFNGSMTTKEAAAIQRYLRSAMNALDACGQSDLAEEVKALFKRVAERSDA